MPREIRNNRFLMFFFDDFVFLVRPTNGSEVGGDINSSTAWEWVQDYPSQPLAGASFETLKKTR